MTSTAAVKIGSANSVVATDVAGGMPHVQSVPTAALTVVPDVVHLVGDPVPVIEDDGGSAFAEVIYIEAVIDLLRRAGTAPEAVALVHPDRWSAYAVDSTRAVLTGLHPDAAGPGLPAATLVAESVAVAASTAGTDGPVVVYDLGASGLTVSVVGDRADGRGLLTRPVHSDLVSGNEFDHALLTHLLVATGAADGLDPATIDSPATVEALARLRHAARAAREELSSATEATVPIALPNVATQARVVRAELEDLLREPITESVGFVTAAIASAELAVGAVARIILTGGVAATPLVSEILTAAVPVPVVLADQPSAAAAIGGLRSAPALPAVEPATTVLAPLRAAPSAPHAVQPAPRSATPVAAVSWRRRIIIAGAAACAAAIAAVALAASTGIVGGTDPVSPPPAHAGTPSSTHASTTHRTSPNSSTQPGRSADDATTAAGRRAATSTRSGDTATTNVTAPQRTTQPRATVPPPNGSNSGGSGNGGSGSGGSTGGGSGSDGSGSGGSGSGNSGSGDDGSSGGSGGGGSDSGGSNGTGGTPPRLLPKVGDAVCGVTRVVCP